MCYICEARGTVGENYRAAQSGIGTALRMLRAGTGTTRWLNAPSKRLWSNADLKEYGKAWRREHLTSEGGRL